MYIECIDFDLLTFVYLVLFTLALPLIIASKWTGVALLLGIPCLINKILRGGK